MFNLPSSEQLVYERDELDRHLARVRQRSSVLRSKRVRRVSVIFSAFATVVVLATSVIVVDATAHQNGSVEPKWSLVSDVSPAWQVVSTTANGFGITLSCPSSTTCYAENIASGSFEVTGDSGTTWQQFSIASRPQLTSGISCASPSSCSLTGTSSDINNLYSTTDGGQTWSSNPLPQAGNTEPSIGSSVAYTYPNIVACSTPTNCLVVVKMTIGSGLARDINEAFSTSNGGQTWRSTQLPSAFYPDNGQCPTSENCLLVGSTLDNEASGEALYSTDGGVTWSTASVPSGSGALNSLSCFNGSNCYVTSGSTGWYSAIGANSASGDSLLMTTDDGVSYSVESSSQDTSGFGNSGPSANFVTLTSNWCVSVTNCWVSGIEGPTGSWGSSNYTSYAGFLASTSDGGFQWNQAILPTALTGITQVVCPDNSVCFAVGVSGWNGAGGKAEILNLQN